MFGVRQQSCLHTYKRSSIHIINKRLPYISALSLRSLHNYNVHLLVNRSSSHWAQQDQLQHPSIIFCLPIMPDSVRSLTQSRHSHSGPISVRDHNTVSSTNNINHMPRIGMINSGGAYSSGSNSSSANSTAFDHVFGTNNISINCHGSHVPFRAFLSGASFVTHLRRQTVIHNQAAPKVARTAAPMNSRTGVAYHNGQRVVRHVPTDSAACCTEQGTEMAGHDFNENEMRRTSKKKIRKEYEHESKGLALIQAMVDS